MRLVKAPVPFALARFFFILFFGCLWCVTYVHMRKPYKLQLEVTMCSANTGIVSKKKKGIVVCTLKRCLSACLSLVLLRDGVSLSGERSSKGLLAGVQGARRLRCCAPCFLSQASATVRLITSREGMMEVVFFVDVVGIVPGFCS